LDFREDAPARISRIRQTITTTEEGQPVRREDLMRGYEVAPGRYVSLPEEELRRLRLATSAAIEIVRSVRLAEIDPVFFETSYYVVPEPAGERAYALLVTALRDTGYVALATLAMRGREHVVVIRPGRKGLLAHTMYYVDEVRGHDEYQVDVTHTNPKELELAKTFVQAIAGAFDPEEFKDAYREGLQNLITEKMTRNEVSAAGQKAEVVSMPATSVIDIMEALRRSLELRRPPATEQKSSAPGTARAITRVPRKRKA
jgi:DNA end-binding protein Ku